MTNGFTDVWAMMRSPGRTSSASGLRFVSRQEWPVLIFFIVQVIAVTVLQKFAFELDLTRFNIPFDVGSIQLALPIFLLGFVVLVFFYRVKVDLYRAAAMGGVLFLLSLSMALLDRGFSPSSLLLLLALYLPCLLFVEVSRPTYLASLGFYANVMTVFCFVVFAQHLVQLVASPRLWPDLDRLVSPDFLFKGYVYIQPIAYGSRLMKPSGVFFLEVSVLSQFIAIAAAIELVYFQRPWRLLVYAIALLATFAGTGLLLLAISGPVLLGRVSLRTMTVVVGVLVLGLFVSTKIHWMENVQQRFGEYQVTGRSANHRFVEPAEVLVDLVRRPESVFSGEGPGTGQKTGQAMWWASTKLAYEYGFASAFAFLGFMFVLLFRDAPSRRLAFMLAVFFNFMAGVIIPSYVILIFLIGGFMRLRKKSGKGKRRTNAVAAWPSKAVGQADR